jgi:hypothetical protein
MGTQTLVRQFPRLETDACARDPTGLGTLTRVCTDPAATDPFGRFFPY